MKKYIKNLEESVSSVLNESLVSDAAELVGIEEEEAEDRIKGLSFANYIELGNAIDLEDAETAREILSTVSPIEEKLIKGRPENKTATYRRMGGNKQQYKWKVTLNNGREKHVWADSRKSVKDNLSPEDLIIGIKSAKRMLSDMEESYKNVDSFIGRRIRRSPFAGEHANKYGVIKNHQRSTEKIGTGHVGRWTLQYDDGTEEVVSGPSSFQLIKETSGAGGTGAGAVGSGGDGGVTAANGYGGIGTWDGKKRKKEKPGLKKSGKGIYEDSSDTLYHVTHTKYIPQITKNGLRPMGAPSNWVQQGSGDRYGMGEIYVFTNYEDAKKWAGRMDWDFNQTIGSGEISIITLRYPEGQDFEKDEADPMSQAGAQGDWLKTYEPIEPENIVDVQVFKSMKESMDLLDKPTMTVREIADKHDVPVADIASQLAKGIKVELEHSNNRKVAKEIALDHLMELPDYYDRLETVEEADNPYASAPSQGSSVDALAQQTDQAEATPTAQDNQEPDQLGRKEVDDLTVGDNIEVIDIDGDPTPVTVKTPRGPGDTLVVQTDKGEEHIVKKQAVSGTPTIQEMYEAALTQEAVEELEEYGYESALTDRVHEAYKARKTEHSGPKKGGAYRGKKADAKKDSNKKRREDDKKAISEKAPPGMEDWIKKRKPEFKDRYGDRWEEVLYATAWKRHNNESVEEDKDEFVKKLQQGDRYFVRREYHIGKKPYDDFEAQVLDVSDTEDTWSGFKHKVRFTDNNGEEVVAWYPEPGKGGLSGRYYDEQLVKAGEKGKYVAGDSRNEWPVVGEDAPSYGNPWEHDEPSLAGDWVVWLEDHYSQQDYGIRDGVNYEEAMRVAKEEAQNLADNVEGDTVISKEQLRDDHFIYKVYATAEDVSATFYFHVQRRNSVNENVEELAEIRRLAGLKETASAGATGAGAVATAPAAMGGMVKRNPSIYDKPTPKKRKKESSDDGIGRSKKK